MVRVSAFALVVLCFSAALPADLALIRIGRLGPEDRSVLLDAGIPLVMDMGSCWLAYGPAEAILPRLDEAGYPARVLDRPQKGEFYHLLALRGGPGCGLPVWQEDATRIVKTGSPGRPPCAGGAAVRWAPLNLERLRPVRNMPMRPEGMRNFLPLVQEMVDGLTFARATTMLKEVVGWADSRYSFDTGCQSAADWAAAAFANAGLTVQLQHWSDLFPPNVIATLRGESAPGDVFIVVAHLDDMPDTPPALGANDNASGSALVLALARAMSAYRFAGTVKFILVTGEEQGMLGSTAYATEALARGENILAVLNADMVGWQGDGHPDQENIDVNYNEASEWLGTLMRDAADLYATGGPVNAFLCPSMVYSDHTPFWGRGWSAIMGITDNDGVCSQWGTYPYYHTHSDRIEYCGDLTFFAGTCRTYLATLAQLAVPIGPQDGSENHRRPLGRPQR